MKIAIACLLILGLSACAAARDPSVSPGEANARVIEERHTQVARLDSHTQVQVTQWNAQLRHAERLRVKGRPQPEQDLVDARVRAWDEQAKGVETYMVLLEIKDADSQRKDPRLDLRNWRFQLSGPGSEPRKATRVELLSQDRFAADSGGAHWRIGARVDFPATKTASPVTLELWAPQEKAPKHGLRARLPQLPARFSFAAQPAFRPAPSKASLTGIQASR